MEVSRVVTREMVIRHKKFVIIQLKNGMYASIDYEWLTDGKMNRRVNGLEAHASKYLEECIRMTINAVEVAHYINEEGMTKAQAFAKVWGLEYHEKMEELF